MIPTLTVKFEGVERLDAHLATFQIAVPSWVTRMAFRTRKAMAELAPVGRQEIHPLSKRTRRRRKLAESIVLLKAPSVREGLSAEAIVGTSGIGHTRYVVEGTDPHDIVARRAKCLTIPANGNFAKRISKQAAKGLRKGRETYRLGDNIQAVGRKRRLSKAQGGGHVLEVSHWRLLKRVHHPGTNPNPFHERAATMAMVGASEEFEKSLAYARGALGGGRADAGVA